MNTSNLPHALARVSSSFAMAVLERPETQDLATRALDAAAAWGQRSSKLGAPLVFWYAVQLMLFREDPIDVVLNRMLRMLREREPEIHSGAVTPEAACKARYRLGPEPVRLAFEETARRIAPPPTFHGFAVYAIDGTTMNMPDTPDNDAAFGRHQPSQGRSAFPQMKVVTLMDVHSHRVRAFEYGPYSLPERPSGLRLLQSLGPGDLAILDRGFPGRYECYAANQCQAKFVVRIQNDWELSPAVVLADGTALVDLKAMVPLPQDQQTKWKKRAAKTVRLRLITYRVGQGEVVRLLTNLLDPETYPAEDIARLYHERWETELLNAELKITLATVKRGRLLTTFRSKRPRGVLQELYALLLANNLIRETMGAAAEAHGIPPRELSFSKAIQILRDEAPRFDAASPEDRPRRRRQLLEDLARARIDRPRRKRTCPRVVKQKQVNRFPVRRPGMKEVRPTHDIRLLPWKVG